MSCGSSAQHGGDVSRDELLKPWERYRRTISGDVHLSTLVEALRTAAPASEQLDPFNYAVVVGDVAAEAGARLLGGSPSGITLVGQALRNRVLVLDSFRGPQSEVLESSENDDVDDSSIADDYLVSIDEYFPSEGGRGEGGMWDMIGESFSEDQWGAACALAVANTLQAEPVIHLDTSLFSASTLGTVKEGMEELGSQEGYEARWRHWQVELAETVSDWLRLLTDFQYI
jgi:hypothetical protein